MRAQSSPSKRITWVAEGVGYRVLADGRRSYCVNYYDSDGRERREFLGPGSTEREAKSKLATIRVAKDKGEQVRPSRITFADYADRWLASLVVGVDIAQSTHDTYAWDVEHRLKPVFGSKPLQKIDKLEVARLIQTLKRNGYAGNTIRNAIKPLSLIFAEAVEEGLVSFNPVEQVSRRKREKLNPKSKRILTLEEVETLLRAAETRGQRWHALVAVFAYGGLRLGEALGLRWGDVDFARGVIAVRK